MNAVMNYVFNSVMNPVTNPVTNPVMSPVMKPAMNTVIYTVLNNVIDLVMNPVKTPVTNPVMIYEASHKSGIASIDHFWSCFTPLNFKSASLYSNSADAGVKSTLIIRVFCHLLSYKILAAFCKCCITTPNSCDHSKICSTFCTMKNISSVEDY